MTFGTISHFDGMETGKVLAHIIEGEITSVNLVYVDGQNQVLSGGSTNPRVVRRELPFRVGTLYNVEDAKRALRDIFLLQLFDNVQVRIQNAHARGSCQSGLWKETKMFVLFRCVYSGSLLHRCDGEVASIS